MTGPEGDPRSPRSPAPRRTPRAPFPAAQFPQRMSPPWRIITRSSLLISGFTLVLYI